MSADENLLEPVVVCGYGPVTATSEARERRGPMNAVLALPCCRTVPPLFSLALRVRAAVR